MPTPLINFRLPPETLAEIDSIAAHLATQGYGGTRADAVRWAVRQAFLRLKPGEKKSEKKKKTA